MNFRASRLLAAAVLLAVALGVPVVHPTESLAATGLVSTSTTSFGDFSFRTQTVRYARLRLLPAPVGQAKAKPSKTNLTPGVASFKPARKGRKVVVQKYRSGWRKVLTGRQNGRGKFSFNVRARKGQVFRAITVGADGAVKQKSASVRARRLDRTFNDTFSNGLRKWGVRMPGSREGGGRRCSESSRKSVRVVSGKLLLKTKRITPDRQDNPDTLLTNEAWDNPDYDSGAPCPYGQFYNGHVGTEGKFSFKHGIMAARIKMQPQRGHHGGFWSNPATDHWSGAEIDAIEYYGNKYSYKGDVAPLQHSIYRGSEKKAKVVKSRNYLLAKGRKWSSDHHIFSVQWTPKRYIFRVDGHETFRTKRGVSQTRQYLILSLLSSDWELPNLPSSGPYTPMSVDWVRVWEY